MLNKHGGGRDSSNPTCSKCGKKGHMQRQCPGENDRGNMKRGPPPGVCPRWHKGKNWKNACKSKFHKDGAPLIREEEEENSKN